MHRFAVQRPNDDARKGFPIKLLHVDQAWPATEAEANVISQLAGLDGVIVSLPDTISINLVSNQVPSATLWAACDWVVVVGETELDGVRRKIANDCYKAFNFRRPIRSASDWTINDHGHWVQDVDLEGGASAIHIVAFTPGTTVILDNYAIRRKDQNDRVGSIINPQRTPRSRQQQTLD